MVTGSEPGEPQSQLSPHIMRRRGSLVWTEADNLPQLPQLLSSFLCQAHHPREHLITGCQVSWGQTNEATFHLLQALGP